MSADRTVTAMLCGWLTAATAVVVIAVVAPPNATGAAPGENLLLNGSFETGGASLTPWIFRHDVAATLAVDTADVADGTRAAKVTVGATSTSTHLVQLRQEGMQLHAGISYTVSFWAKASGPRVINARLQSPVAPYPTFKARDFTLGTDWRRFAFAYTSPSDVSNAFVGFNLAQALGDVSLDQLALYESNQVRNGGFETGGAALSPWIWRNDIDAGLTQDTTVKFAGAASAKITVPTVGAASHLVQLRTPIPLLDRNSTYLVSFQVMASSARLANVRLQSSDAPYPTVASKDFNVTSTWSYVGFQWAPKLDVTNPFLGFNLAQDTGTIWIDDVSFTEVPSGIITTVAGGGVGDGGQATDAVLNTPFGVAVDAAGNRYIADYRNARVRKVTPAGTISTVAGNGTEGFSGDGGPATNATIGSPGGVAVDAAGNLYIADQNNQRVRKVSPSGTISTVAGNGTNGFSGDGGPAANATLAFPYGIAVDTAGNLYIADENNSRVRKVSPAGTISTVAGNGTVGFSGDGGPAADANLNHPSSVAVDTTGTLFIGDLGNNRVRKVSPSGTISTVAGNGTVGFSGDGGPATNAALSFPKGVAVDTTGNLYIADQDNARVRKVSPSGMISTVAGNGTQGFSGDGGPATSAALSFPKGVAVDTTGKLYVVDIGNHRVREVSPAGTISTLAGNGTNGFSGDGGRASDATVDSPFAAAVDTAGNLYIADTSNHRVRRVSPSGTISTVAGNGADGFSGDGGPATHASLFYPNGVTVDAAGNLYIADQWNQRVRRVSPAGTISTVAGNGSIGSSGDGGPATYASLNYPQAIAVDAAGNLYIADTSNNRVRKVSPAGTISTVAGNGTARFSGDGGPAVNATLNKPAGLAFDAAGNLYIADSWNKRVRKVSPAGTISTVAGNRNAGFSGDGGQAVDATLGTPHKLAVDAAGSLYIVDNFRVRKVSPSGTILTVAGNGTIGFSGDGGSATTANLSPDGVAVDAAGNLIIAESRYDRVRKVTSP